MFSEKRGFHRDLKGAIDAPGLPGINWSPPSSVGKEQSMRVGKNGRETWVFLFVLKEGFGLLRAHSEQA